MAVSALVVSYVPYEPLGMKLKAIDLRNCPMAFQRLFMLLPQSLPYCADLFFIISNKVMMFDPFIDGGSKAAPMGFRIHEHSIVATGLCDAT